MGSGRCKWGTTRNVDGPQGEGTEPENTNDGPDEKAGCGVGSGDGPDLRSDYSRVTREGTGEVDSRVGTGCTR